VKGFFIPFRMGYEKWQLHANNAGIIFDRCRIANLAHNQTSPPKIAAWIKKTLKELSK